MKYIKIIVICSFSSEPLEYMEIKEIYRVIILSVLLIHQN